MKRKLLTVLIGGLVAAVGVPAQAQDDADRVGTSVRKAATKPMAKPAVTAEQRAMLNEKLAIVARLMQSAGADRAGAAVTPERQRWMLESMYKLPLATLRGMAASGSPDLLSNEIAKATVASKASTKLEGPSFGDATGELVYLPQAPCRWIDTRNVGGPLVGTRQFDMEADGTSYGGSAGCTANGGIGSANVGAVAMNVAIVGPTAAPGFIGARPVGSTATTALVNWYQAGPSVQASNAGIITNDQGAPVDDIEFFGSPTNFIVDVFGVFGSPTATALNCQYPSSTLSVAAGAFGSITVTCPTGYTVVAGGWDGASLGVNGSSINPENYPIPASNQWRVTFYNRDTSAFTMEAFAVCCRIPGR